MDPNETLRQLRKVAEFVISEADKFDPPDQTEAAEDMATLFRALDEWMSKGGFLPEEWERMVRARDVRMDR